MYRGLLWAVEKPGEVVRGCPAALGARVKVRFFRQSTLLGLQGVMSLHREGAGPWCGLAGGSRGGVRFRASWLETSGGHSKFLKTIPLGAWR